ncbi:MAG: hypothetical protein KDD16_11875, partial [Mangrovimonas sp.]|nr:hypothetical protein [Mangrovimonas sp.]
MRKILLLITLLFAGSIHSQDLLMQNGTFNQCSGVFYDSGGASGNYGDNENYVITICPDNPGDYVQLDFTQFSIQF